MQLPPKNYANNFLTLVVLLICFTTWTTAQINWQQANGPYGAAVYTLAVSGTNLFAGTYGGGVFLSTNNGTSWSAVNNGLTNTYVNVLSFNGTNLFAGTEAGVFISTNNGTSWSAVNNGLPSTYIYSLIFNGTNIFAGTIGGVFLSTDNGSSWSQVSTGLINTNVHALVVSDANFFAGTFGGGIFLSTDNGSSWSAANNGLTSTYIYSLILSGANLFAGTDDGLFLSTNNGSSWSAVNTGLPNSSIYTFAHSGTNLFAGTGSGVFLSTNNGSSWTAVSSGLTTTYVWSLAVSGTNLFAGTYGGGVFLSTNNGSSWSAVNTGLINTFVGALAISGSNLFAGTNDLGVFLSTNNGSSWNAVNTGLSSKYVCALAVSGTNLFAGLVGGVFLSTNNGSSWTSVNTGLTDANIRTLAISGSNLFAGTNGGGVFLSTNNGSTWKTINTGLTDINVNTLTISGTNLFAGTLGGGVFLSTNNGTSWSAVNAGLTNTDVRALAVSGTNLFAGTTGGVFLSTNNGTSWSTANYSLTNTVVYALAVRGTDLFAGTMYSGVILSTNNGSSWSTVNTGLTRTHVLSLAVNDTNLFAGTFGGGVFVGAMPTTTAPTITSFAPTSGPIGSTVTIVGNNFITTAENNIVYFGAVKATLNAATSTSLSVTVPTGVTYQPITVTNVTTGLTAYSSKPFTVTFPSSRTIDMTSFMPKVDFMTGGDPFNTAISDMDGDGKPDLVIQNWSDHTVSVFRNTSTSGTINASSFASKVDFATGTGSWDVAIGDMDGDGKPDLIISCQNYNTVSILRNISASGSITAASFAPKVDFSTGTGPNNVAIRDMDGDGKPDIIVTNNLSNTVSILRNTSSSGSINASSFAPNVEFITGMSPNSVAIGDVDGDGKPDIVVTLFSSNIISVLKNKSTSGSITADSFAPKIDFITGSEPTSVALGDMDGDSKLDLVVTNGTSNTVSVFTNTSTYGSIATNSFASKVDFTTGLSPYRVAISDVDGDGKPDIILANMNGASISVFRNTNDSSSITASSFVSRVDFASKLFPQSVIICDVDGDGKPDLVVTNANSNTVSILRNTMGGSSPHPTIVSFIPTHNALNVSQSTGVTITFDTIMNAKSFTDSTIRINGSLSGLHPATFSYNSSTKTATITPITPFKIGELVTVTLTSKIKSQSGDSLTNGFSWSFTIKTNACSGFFYQSSTAGVGNTPWYVAAADFNGDSAIDLAVVNNYGNDVSILTNNGKGIFTKTSAINVGNYPGSITAADLDGDGDMDLAVTNSQSNTVSILKNDGHGTFTQTSVVSVATNPWNVAAADLDGDGAIDLAIAGYSGTVSILKNDGNGSFTLTSTITVGSHAYSVTAADLNGDGAIDLAVTDYGSNTVAILTNNGSGGFILTSTIHAGMGSMAAAAADFDGDGAIDLAVANFYSNTISILKNNGSGIFTLTSTINTENYPTSIIAMDAEGNGIMDLAVVNAGSGSVSILKNNGSGSFTLASTVSTDIGSSPRIVTAADFDGDGRIDLAAVILNLNSVSILKNRVAHATIGIPSSLFSFGSVSVGSSKSEYLKIYNYGTDSSLVVSNITSSDAAFIVHPTSLSIAASGCDSILVTFLPTTKNTLFNDSLIFTSNDAENPNAKINLTGSSTISQLKASFILNLGGPIYAGMSVLGDNAMYAIASGDAVYRMNTAGSVAYKIEVAGDIRSSSSIAYDTTVYIASSDRNLYAFSKDGNSIWSLPTGGVLTATSVVDSIANRLYIGVSNHNFIAVNRSTGKVDWNYFADDQIRNSAVVTSDRKLIFASQKGTLYGFDLNNLTLPAAPSWQIALPDTAPSSIALDNQGYIYIGTSAGYLLKISMPANQQPSIVWQILLGQAIVGSPVIDATGTVYAGSLDANLYAVDIQTGSVKWTFSTKGAIRSTPAISNAGTIFVANDSGEVISLDINKNILWYYKTNSSIVAPLLYYQSTLYAGTLGNQVIALFDAADSSLLHKTGSSQQKTGKPVWATFQGNNQRTGMYSSSGTNDGTTGINKSGSGLPVDYTLMQNYPNPFNPSTTIQFALPKEGRVSMKVFNILGKHIATLLDGFQSAGYHEVTVNLDAFSSGIYFYQMRVGSFIETKKMMLMK